MIHPVRIYDAKGKLVKTVSSKQLHDRSRRMLSAKGSRRPTGISFHGRTMVNPKSDYIASTDKT